MTFPIYLFIYLFIFVNLSIYKTKNLRYCTFLFFSTKNKNNGNKVFFSFLYLLESSYSTKKITINIRFFFYLNLKLVMSKNSQFNFFFVTQQLLLQLISPFSQGYMYIPFLNTQKKNRICKVLTESNLLRWFHVLYCSPIGEVGCRLHRSSLIFSNAYLNYIKKKTLNSLFYMKYLIQAVKNKNKWFVISW